MATASDIDCDLAIVGGGLAGGLAALALAEARPELRLLLIEGGPALGGNHVWSFFDSDVADEDRALVAPLVAHGWDGYDIRFPAHSRTLPQGYRSITSARFDAHLRATLGPERIRRAEAVAVEATRVVLADQGVIRAGGVIDARGAGDVATLEVGWQKFLGQELVLDRPHGLTRPIVMDATVEQIDGYRFVYVLPFGPERLFVEDTYYSDAPALDPAVLRTRIADYAAARGWTVTAIGHEETGALPVTMGGDFAAYWASTGEGVGKLGVRAGLFHPTTGYSLPDAVRTARFVAGLADLSGPALATALRARAEAAWARRGFYRLLDRMLFRAAVPQERYRVLERFYRLRPALIGRFYAARSTPLDVARLVMGKPPVPFWRGVRTAFFGGVR